MQKVIVPARSNALKLPVNLLIAAFFLPAICFTTPAAAQISIIAPPLGSFNWISGSQHPTLTWAIENTNAVPVTMSGLDLYVVQGNGAGASRPGF